MVNNVDCPRKVVVEPPPVGGDLDRGPPVVRQAKQDIQRNGFLGGNFLSRCDNARERSDRKGSLFIHDF
jgi:hypothetical protein